MISVLDETKITAQTTGLKCPSEDTHRWLKENPLVLLSFCLCEEWQIVEIISNDYVKCVNIQGEIRNFDRV